MNKKLPFMDSLGHDIFEGSIISQMNYNGQEYRAVYEVVVDPHGGSKETAGFCLQMLSGNKKAMDATGLSSFGSIVDNKLKKGIVKI